METIKLDLVPGKKMPSLHASQFDDGRAYHIDLTENRVPYTLDGTETISVIVRKCDNTLVSMDIANTFADKSYIEFEVVEQMTACSGFNYGEIILEKNGDRLGSLNFYLQVEAAPDENGITSTSEVLNLARQVHDIVVEELADNGAEETGYDNTESGLEATNVQDAIDELARSTPEDVYTKEESDEKFATKSNPVFEGSFSQNRNSEFSVGDKSFAAGNNTTASGANSFSAGNNSAALGNNAHAEGFYTQASGSASHSEGRNTNALGNNSHAEGNATRASHASQHVFGEFNKFDPSSASATQRGNFVEIVGNGTSANDRSNARTLDWQGNEMLAGNLIINGNTSVADGLANRYTKSEVNEKVLSIMPTGEANGSPAAFETSFEYPLVSIKANITGTETGTGTRTPGNPYVITSFDSVELKHYADDVADADVVTIDLGGEYYLGELIISDNGDGTASVKLIGKYKKITIGSSLLSSASWYDTYKQLGFSNILTDAKYNANLTTYTCNKLVPIENTARSTHIGNYITLIGSGSGVAVSIPNCTTEALAKAFFNNDTLTFCYELATPIEINLPDIQSISSFIGENNILANSGSAEVIYKNSLEDIANGIEEEVADAQEETKQYVKTKTTRTLEIKTIKLASSQSPDASIKNLCFVCGKWISKENEEPDYEGYLFVEPNTDKFYYTDDLSKEPQFLFDWDGSLDGGAICRLYAPTITADGDIVFLMDHAMANPIVYPHGDYSHPYVVDFGANRKPFGWLMSSSVVHFDDGSFCFGDYAYHSQEDEQNDVRRNIWHVSKPYNVVSNWEIAHSFKHVYFTSPQSNEPDNEIGHIHAIMYDFYADDLYCTTGDIDRHCRMWVSTDHGETWAAVPGAVGTTADTTASAEGQKWRMTNGIFTKDAMWWATDSAKPYHKLWKCDRGLSGHIDFDTLTEVTDLETPALPNGYSQRTYITALTRNPAGLLLLDRGEPRPDKLDVKFYDFASGEVEIVRTFERATTDASELDRNDRIGLCQQATTAYQPQTSYGIITGGGKVVRPNNTSEFNNSKSNYVGALIMRLK